MEKYKIKRGAKYFNWNCIGQLLLEMKLKADRIHNLQLREAAQDVSYASHVYINTGRAGTEWVKAWSSASHDKLFKYVLNSYNGSIQSATECITQYLKKYCRLSV